MSQVNTISAVKYLPGLDAYSSNLLTKTSAGTIGGSLTSVYTNENALETYLELINLPTGM